MEVFAFLGLTAQILLFVNRVTGGTMLLATTMDFSHDRVSVDGPACVLSTCSQLEPVCPLLWVQSLYLEFVLSHINLGFIVLAVITFGGVCFETARTNVNQIVARG